MHAWLIFALSLLSTATAMASPLVAVDVGHGLRDGGAISARGRDEFAFNRDLAEVLANQLPGRGLAVLPVNFDGGIEQLADRPRAAAGADFFLSIHHDSVGVDHLQPWEWQGQSLTHTEVKRGYGLFVSAWNPDLPTSLLCATTMGSLLRQAGFVPTSWHGRRHLAADAANGVWYYDNLVVLYRTTLPAVLFEAGVIKHRDEELELADPVRQQRMAEALASGLAACLSVSRLPAAGPAPFSP